MAQSLNSIVAIFFGVVCMMAFHCSEHPVDAFVVGGYPRQQSSLTPLFVSRRSMLETTVAIMTCGGAALVSSSAPVLAEGFDDLAMPSEEEQKQSEEDAMNERLRRKAELQKAQAKPATFKDSMEAERRKQDALKKSKEERRNALCEELGRGC